MLDGQKHTSFYATTYSTSPLNLQTGKSLESWLLCLQARKSPSVQIQSNVCFYSLMKQGTCAGSRRDSFTAVAFSRLAKVLGLARVFHWRQYGYCVYLYAF